MGSPESLLIVAGPIGSGKTTAARYLERFGYRRVACGDIVRSMCRARGGETGRRQLQGMGSSIMKLGPEFDEFVARLIDACSVIGSKAVIEGLRATAAVPRLRVAFEITVPVLFITCPIEVRALRVSLRDGINRTEFDLISAADIEIEGERFAAIADIHIANDGVPELFETRLFKVLQTWR